MSERPHRSRHARRYHLRPVAEVLRTRDDGAIATARYTDPGFAALEHERLWGRVWQGAGREEQVATPGDVLEYRIGDASVLVTRDRVGALHAMRNACRHRGSPLVQDRARWTTACSARTTAGRTSSTAGCAPWWTMTTSATGSP